MPTMKVDYLRVLGEREVFSRHPAEVHITPLGGAVMVRHGSKTAEVLCDLGYGTLDARACLQPKAWPTVHPGLKAEVLYAYECQAEAHALLKTSKGARDYALALVGIPPYDQGAGPIPGTLEEFQSLARSISAAIECLSVLEELGIQ